MKKTFFTALSIISFSSALFAQDNDDFLPSVQYCSGQNKTGGSLDFLIVQPKEDGLDYSLNNASSTRELNATVNKPDFKWSFGARGGLNFIFAHDNWDLDLNGAFLISNTKDKTQQNVVNQTSYDEDFNGQGLIPIWIHPRSFAGHQRNVRFSNAKAKWDLSYYDINLLLGKNFCISDKIQLHPSFGISNVFNYQKYTINYANGKKFFTSETNTITPISSVSKNIQNIYGIGPKLGLNSKWFFQKNINLFADIYASLLYDFFDIKRHDVNNYTANDTESVNDFVKIKNKVSSVKPNVDIALGISYENCIERTNLAPLFVQFSLGYEANLFWSTNKFIQFADDVNDGLVISPDGDFQMQGIYVGFKCMF